MDTFEQTIKVQWRDVDYNQHARHSVYYDYGAHLRIRFFQEVGYPMARLGELNIGPILFHEECTFLREIKLEDSIRLVLLRGDLREDGSRWSLHHEMYNQHGEQVAHITVKGAWMDLEKRKLTHPPKELVEALLRLPAGTAFVYHSKSKN